MSVRFVFLLSTWAQERFSFPPPEGFLGGKWSKKGPPPVLQMLVPGMLFASFPDGSVTSVGPCEEPGVGGKQHRGQGGMGTCGDSLVPWSEDIWPCSLLFSQPFGKRRGSSQAGRGL